MNFQPLFTTARVVTAVYRIASTTLLLMYLARRVRKKQHPHYEHRIRSHHDP
jgi:hypothetical protein